ncbi:hypothetical protein F2Q69_00035648 [Brassica cretica]|uniref:Uncharacterized protein n=1 Tax=Brassica cretica TaxID=69181 RepID=A0A8S9SNT1_BRACR|nr:hypothetical protein F2Q69_00035648 [Brassica cretica]
MKDSKVINRKRAKREQRGLISEFAFEREQQPCELVCVGRGGSWPAFRPAPPVLPNRGFLLPRSWVFRRTRPAEQTGFAFFLGGCQHRRPSDRTGHLYPGRCARFLLLR